MRVLIVEDEGIIAWDIEAIVIELGHEVVGLAVDMPSALALAGEADFALVDVRLSDGQTGPAIAQRLVEDFAVPVVYLTGNAEIVEHARSGALGVVTKPHSPQKIRAALDLGLAHRRGEAPGDSPLLRRFA